MTPEPAPAGVDVVVGLLTYNNADTATPAALATRAGLQRMAGASGRIVWADGGSSDDTPARTREALAGDEALEVVPPQTTADFLEMPYHGIPGKARALHAILREAHKLNARACVMVDAGTASLAPGWIEALASPVLTHGCDFVSPFYVRRPQEGALTRGLVYPLVRALYGARLRQPASAEFACSPRLRERLLDEDIWESEGAQIGVDLWLTTSAASDDFRLAETSLGSRVHRSRGEEALDLATTLRQVVGSLFADLDLRADRWQRVRGSIEVQQFGESARAASPPAGDAAVDVERLMASYRLGNRELRDIWAWVLPPRTVLDLRRLVEATPTSFRLEDDLWARIIYDFALGYRLRALPRDHLLGSLTPLYLGWLASFLLQIRGLDAAAVEERVDRLALAFEAQKPYLIARWRWPERVRS